MSGLDELADKLANQTYDDFRKRQGAANGELSEIDRAWNNWGEEQSRKKALRLVVDNDTELKTPTSTMVLTSGEFIKNFTPPDYLLDGIMQRRYLYSLTGQTGAGKTAVMLLLAAMIAQGLPFGSAATQMGRVLYLAGENPDDIRMRWIAMADKMGFDTSNIDVHFIPGVFRISEAVDAIALEMEKLGGVTLVIVDTSATYFEGNEENANTELLNHAKMFRKLTEMPGGPTVIAACHPAKGAGNDALVPRGGGAFVNEMDGNLVCKKHEGRAEIHWHLKHRGVNFEPVNIEMQTVLSDSLRDSKGRKIPTVIAVPLSEEKALEIENQSRWDENKILISIAGNQSISIAGIAQDNGWRYSDGQPNKSKVQRGIKELKRENFIRKKRGRIELTELGRKEVEIIRNDPVKAAKY